MVNYWKWYIPVICLGVVNCVLSHKLSITTTHFTSLQNKYCKIQKFTNNPFVMNHLRSNENNVLQYLKEIINENKLTVISAKGLDNNVLELDLLCWHDKYLFNFLNQVNNFSNGFIRIKSLVITKSQKFSLKSPNLNVKLICTLYTNI